MDWARYIGIPKLAGGRTLAGLDCWGLPWLIYRDELGILLPEYDGAYVDTSERDTIARLIDGGRHVWRDVDSPRPFDLLLFEVEGIASHIGIARNAREMLHVEDRDGSCCVELRRSPWRRRLVAIGRHEALA